MSKPKAKPSIVPFTGEAVTCSKYDSLLTEAFVLEIVEGVVVSIKAVTRAPDLPVTSIGKAQAELWKQLRTQQGVGELVDAK